MIKQLACKVPILKPIDARKDEPIWVICDASLYGVGAVYGQGPDWQTCRPAGFMSKKYTAAQHAYRVFELEPLAILEALLKWENKLSGYPINIVTDHQALEFFKTQTNFNPRQTRWMEYLERFNYRITYIKGELNRVADCLSRYYLNDRKDETHAYDEYVNADVRFDPEGDELTAERRLELRTKRIIRKPARYLTAEELEERQAEAKRLEENKEVEKADEPPEIDGQDIAEKSVPNLYDIIREGYKTDTVFSKIIACD